MPPFEFCPILWDWGELRIPNLARMLQYVGFTLFTAFWSIKGRPTGGKNTRTLIRVNLILWFVFLWYGLFNFMVYWSKVNCLLRCWYILRYTVFEITLGLQLHHVFCHIRKIRFPFRCPKFSQLLASGLKYMTFVNMNILQTD